MLKQEHGSVIKDTLFKGMRDELQMYMLQLMKLYYVPKFPFKLVFQLEP
jgi:hypothetical protein